MKNKMSFRKVGALHLRAVGDIRKICPGLFWITTLHAVLSAVLPYIMFFVSARMLNELAGARRPNVLLYWALAGVLVIGVLNGINSYLLRKRETQVEVYWRRQQNILTNKLFSMDYPDIERKSTHEKYTMIQRMNQSHGYGLLKIQTIYARLLHNTTGVVSAVALTVGLFTAPLPETAGSLTVLNHPLFVFVIAGIAVGGCLCSGELSKRAEEKYMTAMQQSWKFANLVDRYVGGHGMDRNHTADVRMYEQHKIIGHYLEKYEVWRSGSSLDRRIKKEVAPLDGVERTLHALLRGLIYLFTCLKAWGGAFGIGSVTQYVGAITKFSDNLADLITYIGVMYANAEALKTTYDFIDMPNTMYQGSLTTEKRSDRKYEVEFKNVSFKYPETDTWVLRHVNTKFNIGKRLAVVGENGSGKTTFIKLLCRLYDPQEGEILLNGIDIRKYNYRDYMDIFSVVFQDYQLLSQPLGANVAGDTVYDRERAEKALIDAGFGERLKTLPNGLDTYLYNEFGESGVEVSVGEAQKIAIARALYKNAPFLILDEPTAALDPLAEAEIYAQLNQIVDDRTAVYISHRLSSCRFCDEIIVFDRGQIVQRGSHEVLVSTDGKYKQLWNAQAQYYAK